MAVLVIQESNGVITEIGSMDPFDLGAITYARWTDYQWKNELNYLRSRVRAHAIEILHDVEVDHNPQEMLTWALSLASFCMRRLIECRLVSDEFLSEELTIHKIVRKRGSKQLDSFIGDSGGRIYENFDFGSRVKSKHDPKYIADKFLHARIVAVISNNRHMPDGMLIASDYQSKNSLFHVSLDEYDGIVMSFLADSIGSTSDSVDTNTGVANAVRTRRP